MRDSKDADLLWDTACRLNRATGGLASNLPPMLFFTDPQRTPEPWVTARHLPTGAGIVYRHFGAEEAGAVAARLKRISVERGLILLIGADADLAIRVGAHGVHLPERDLDHATALAKAHPDWIITGTVHDPDTTADLSALSAIILSPVFAAGGSSADKLLLGRDSLSTFVLRQPRPVYALGGIGPKNARDLMGSGACGLAAVGAIQKAYSPKIDL